MVYNQLGFCTAFGCGLQAAPWQGAPAKVYEHVAQALQVVSSAALDAQVRVDAGVSGSSGQVLVFPVRNVQMRSGIPVLFGQTKVNDVDARASSADPHQKIVGFDVTVDEAPGVYVFDPADEAICQQKHRFVGELAVAVVEKILQRRAEEVDHHGVVVALGAVPPDEGDPDASTQGFVHFCFVLELGMLCFGILEFYGDFFAGDDVGAQVDVAEGAAADFAADPILLAHSQIHYGVYISLRINYASLPEVVDFLNAFKNFLKYWFFLTSFSTLAEVSWTSFLASSAFSSAFSTKFSFVVLAPSSPASASFGAASTSAAASGSAASASLAPPSMVSGTLSASASAVLTASPTPSSGSCLAAGSSEALAISLASFSEKSLLTLLTWSLTPICTIVLKGIWPL